MTPRANFARLLRNARSLDTGDKAASEGREITPRQRIGIQACTNCKAPVCKGTCPIMRRLHGF